jgi:hypothetical protein
MEESDELDEYIDRLINAELSKLIAEQIAPHTCQLLKNDASLGIVPFASGVLIELGGSCYLTTASHVIEDWSDTNKLFIEFRKGEYISVVGKGSGTEIEKKEKLDIAYIKLKDDLVLILKLWYKFLPNYRFLKADMVFDEANYCSFGFPVSMQKKEDGIVKPFGVAHFMRPHQDKVFEYYELDPLAHFALEYVGKATNIKTNKREKINTEHYGLSGGGLWYTTITYNDKINKFHSEARLIGIMTEFRKGKYECLIANRIEILLASLMRNEGLKFRGKKI